MPTVAAWPFAPENTFVRDLDGLFVPWGPAGSPEPRLLALNDDLATELGFDPDALRSADGLALLAGNAVPEGLTPVSQAYAGHQFGGYSPRLGDGRALLLGEVVDRNGRRRDLHMKGSGRTPFARGGDGKAAIGPMVRELIIGEAMHGLGIPTTRALAVVATGEPIARDAILPGAVLTRVAASHLRVGTFQFAAATGDRGLLERLVDHAIDRHHEAAAGSPNRALALLEAAVVAQASLVARWMLVGFVHGVMNTDNTTISGETIDYGPCAFIDSYDPAAVFSSIDHDGRYAFGNQPSIMAWNLARLAEALLPLIDDDTDAAVEAATAVLHRYPDHLAAVHEPGMRAKLGLDPAEEEPGDPELAGDLLALMHERRADFTSTFRSLSSAARGDEQPFRRLLASAPLDAGSATAPALLAEPLPISASRPVDLSTLDQEDEKGGSPRPAPGSTPRGGDESGERAGAVEHWLQRWLRRIGPERESAATTMDAVNPVYIPRNHLVEEALDAATDGDMGPTERLLDVLRNPFTERPGLERYSEPAPTDFGPYQTFCGT